MTIAIYSGCVRKINDTNSVSSQELFRLVGGNTGNIAFTEAIYRHLAEEVVTIPWGGPDKDLLQSHSILVVPSANQFGHHCDMSYHVARLEHSKVPMAAIGLGAQAQTTDHDADPPQGTLRWIEKIQSQAISTAPNISVRGDYTYRQLERFGLHRKSVVLGCPSLFLVPAPGIGKQIASRISDDKFHRIAVVAGHRGLEHLAAIEQSLVRIVIETNGAYIVQDPLEMIQLARGGGKEMPSEVISQISRHLMGGGLGQDLCAWAAQYMQLFCDVDTWIEFYRDFDLVIGPRIHGVVLGLLAGIPSICIAHDARTVELCETMKVPMVKPERIANGVTIDSLPELIEFDGDEFDKNRYVLAKRYVEFLRSNRLPESEKLRVLASLAP